MRARVVLALVMMFASTAGATGNPALRAVARRAQQDPPVVELVTMGVGSLIWERHGHIALCIVEQNPMDDACYNYGVADFSHPLDMTAGFFRGTHSFWVEKMDPGFMLEIYRRADRTIWMQPLPLTAEQKQKVIAKLEDDILEEHKYYAYDHFWDNCTTRVRDIIDNATDHALSSMQQPPGDQTYRDLAREGFYGVGHYIPLFVTDLAMGRVTDRVPDYYERMFLPDFLREAVATKWGIQPIVVYERTECRGNNAPGCKERGAPFEPHDSGRIWLALFIILLTSPAWATRLLGRFQRTGIAVAVVPYVFLGTIFWFLAIISPLPYVRWNESCLVLLPTDLLLVWFLSPERRRKYARGRVAMLALTAVLLVIHVLKQPLWPALLWPLIPAAVVGFWPSGPVKADTIG